MKRVEESQVDEVHGKALIIDGRDPTHLMFIFTREEKPDYYASIKEGGLTAILVDAAWLYDRFADMARSFATWYDRVRERNSDLCIALSSDLLKTSERPSKMKRPLSF